MTWWTRLRSRSNTMRGSSSGDLSHLRGWAQGHQGVEAFVEPRTTVTRTTVLLVDATGAWTRREVADPARAHKLARSIGMPIYDAQLVGYPQRMRDHETRARVLRERARRDAL